MRVPLAWLRDYVDLPDADAVVARLASLGFPVDDVESRPPLHGIVAGRITKVAPHPNADRLQLCTIDAGDVTLTIATAATNVAADQIVPVARIGAQLAGGMTIAPRKMRGVDSEGMLCSAGELGLPPDGFEDGIMQLDASVPIGADIVAHFRLSEPVLDVDVTPNRPDAMAIVGLARELAAALGTALREPATRSVPDDGRTPDARVTIETVDCSQFIFARASGLTVAPAPAWMRIRLALAGQRPINNLVDISNFVMIEVGQPMHFFDYARVDGAHLIVRDARDGEAFTTLDGQERRLDPRMIVIADERGPTSLAGIMGGLRSEVQADTTDVLIEAASWTGPRIRRAAAALKLRTEASTRFEKSLTPGLAQLGAARAAQLLAELGGTVGPLHAAGPAPRPAQSTIVGPGDVQRLLGFSVDSATIERSLTALGFAAAATSDGVSAAPPYWRGDIAITADYVEEIARIVGYDRVVATVPATAAQDVDSDAFDRETELADTMAALGYTEALSLSLQSASAAGQWRDCGIAIDDVVEIRNPLSEDQRYMRFSLLPALLAFAARDRAVRPYRTFELGRVFTDAQPDPHEAVHLSAVHAGGESAFGRLTSDLLMLLRRVTGRDARAERGSCAGMHPGKCAALRIDDDIVAYVGVIDPRLAASLELAATTAVATLFVASLPARIAAAYTPPSRFPALERDLAVVVAADVLAGDVLDVVRGDALVRSATVFDEYRGPQVGDGKKSLTLRVTLQSDTATLTDSDADAAVERIVGALHERVAAILRT